MGSMWAKSSVRKIQDGHRLRTHHALHNDGDLTPHCPASHGAGGRIAGSTTSDMSSGLPPGWEMKHNQQGRVYYVNHNDQVRHRAQPCPPYTHGTADMTRLCARR
jgi:hypothetical protein